MLGHFEMTPTFLAHLSQGRRLPLLEIMAPAVEWVVPPAFIFAAGSTPEGMRRSRGILISRRWGAATKIRPRLGDKGGAKQLCRRSTGRRCFSATRPRLAVFRRECR